MYKKWRTWLGIDEWCQLQIAKRGAKAEGFWRSGLGEIDPSNLLSQIKCHHLHLPPLGNGYKIVSVFLIFQLLILFLSLLYPTTVHCDLTI